MIRLREVLEAYQSVVKAPFIPTMGNGGGIVAALLVVAAVLRSE